MYQQILYLKNHYIPIVKYINFDTQKQNLPL